MLLVIRRRHDQRSPAAGTGISATGTIGVDLQAIKCGILLNHKVWGRSGIPYPSRLFIAPTIRERPGLLRFCSLVPKITLFRSRRLFKASFLYMMRLGFMPLDNGPSGQGIGAFIFGMTGMPFAPTPLNIVSLDHIIQALPEVGIQYRSAGSLAPAALFPAVDPPSDAILHIGGISGQPQMGSRRQALQGLDGRHEFHAVVGGFGLIAAERLLLAITKDQRPPAARSWIAATGAVGIDFRIE